jgi:thioredoxin
MDEEERIKAEKMKKMAEKLAVTKIDVNDSNFEKDVMERSKNIPVVVDFWSQMCPPCLILGPILEKLAEEYKGRFILAKANVEEARSTAISYGVMSIPSVKMFKSGKVFDEFIGALPEQIVKEWLDKNL